MSLMKTFYETKYVTVYKGTIGKFLETFAVFNCVNLPKHA